MKRIGILMLAAASLVVVDFAWAGGQEVDLGGLKSKTPDNWKMEKPAGNLRKFQFALPSADGDKEGAELVVFSFGGNSSVDENIARWKAQFIAPEGKSIDDMAKVEKYKVGKAADVVCLDISGTFKSKFPPNDPKAKEQRKENFRRFNVIFDTDKGVFFITLTGPAKTMAKNKDAFDGWIKAFK